MEPVYRPVVGVALTLFKAMSWKIDVSGAHHIPTDGPAVIATNHVGYLDFVFVGYAARESKRLVRFMAKKEVFDHKISGPLMRGMKHLPVDRFGTAAEAIDVAVASLKAGEIVGMFPEGTISRSFVPRAGKTGAARMAMAAGAPLIPGAVWGSQRILTKGRPKNFERRIPISVSFGDPIDYTPVDDPIDVTKRLMASITELTDREQRTYPDKPKSSEDAWWLPAHLGGTAPTVEEADAIAAREREERARRRRAEG
ncbi:MAG: 1-acyl-sn-glycerol-3-phosphate acyltransferase [Actinomycetota bacterium]|nr:1-acyl-sn-glycerol-3-phosphate acyltransferase [Actinomycetota bacterium]